MPTRPCPRTLPRPRLSEPVRHPFGFSRALGQEHTRPALLQPHRSVKSSRTRRRRPFYPRPAGVSRYWRLVDDGQARRAVPPPHLFDLWIMILASRGLPYRLAGRGNRLRLYVPALLEKLSRAELAAVAAETHRPVPQSDPPARHNAHWVLLLLLVLICWHGVRMHWSLLALLPGVPNLEPSVWLDRGAVDVFRVSRLHEWYRCVTALTLHADSQHLFGNVLFGAPFLILLCRRVGLGLGLAMVVLAGALGNGFNVLYRPADHVSLGFSTALFGTVGALSGFLALHGWRLRSRRATAQTALTLIDRLAWRRGILLLAAGTGILAMLGTEGARTDYAAHLFGLLAGFGVGGVSSVVLRWAGGTLSRPVETLLGLAAAFAILGAWSMAL